MKKGRLLSILLAVVSAGLAIFAYVMLPDRVVVQFSAGSSGNSTAPKLLAILIATALGVGGAVASQTIRNDAKASVKSLIVSFVGIAVSIFMIIVNFPAK